MSSPRTPMLTEKTSSTPTCLCPVVTTEGSIPLSPGHIPQLQTDAIMAYPSLQRPAMAGHIPAAAMCLTDEAAHALYAMVQLLKRGGPPRSGGGREACGGASWASRRRRYGQRRSR